MSLNAIPCIDINNRLAPEAAQIPADWRRPIAADVAYNTLLPADKDEVGEVAALLDNLLREARGDFSTMMHTVPLDVLRKLDSWGIKISGELVGDYFDLGSIDDRDPTYPITTDELRALRGALARLEHAGDRLLCPRGRTAGLRVVSGGV
ncbi:hypothetical protein K6V92_03470 [Cupriavidus respiraculi]|uniref:hypothetical protein n=1 Tax=Cupriavidus respiraculi TaxID=195930 RepID=UPI001C94DACB|nr:hypothetical protein [Cupriavidus respiraculi]MBY4945681.1 hypothetical protein [Cupriavidus respiraculi]